MFLTFSRIMKKYLLLLCLATSVAVITFAQSFQLSDSTGPIANNGSLLKYGLPSADVIISNVFIKNTTANPIPVKVKKVETALLHGAYNSFCWGLCYIPEIFVSPDSLIIEAGATDSINFAGHYFPNGKIGISTIQYVFFSATHPSDSVCVNINYDTYPQGISNHYDENLSHAFPNPANNIVNFSFTVNADYDSKLIIRNVFGLMVKEIVVSNESDRLSLNTSEWAEGVYFYSFLVDGNLLVTKKLVIRH